MWQHHVRVENSLILPVSSVQGLWLGRDPHHSYLGRALGGMVVDDNLTLGITYREDGGWGLLGEMEEQGRRWKQGSRGRDIYTLNNPVTSQGSSSNIFFDFQNLKTY